MIVLLVSLVLLIPRYNYSFVSYIKDGSTVSFYTTTTQNYVPNFVTQTDIGIGAILECKSNVAKSLAKQLHNIAGISFCFEGNSNDINEFLDNVDAVVLKCENVDKNIKTYLAYSPKFQNNINIDGNTINLQIAKVGNTITIGSPMILGSY